MTALTPEGAEAFIRANTALAALPLIPEIRLHLAGEVLGLWHKTQAELDDLGLPPPFWAFAWPGGQAVARYVLNRPETVRGMKVLDFAAGSGLVAIAAAMAGAAGVIAADTDPFCRTAVALNAAANGIAFEAGVTSGDGLIGAGAVDFVLGDPVGTDGGWHVVLAGDVFYDAALAPRLVPWFEMLARRGAAVLVGDPERYYMPRKGFEKVATYLVPVNAAVEDDEIKRTTVWRLG
jgi:predicted nicotinamide N-methyase